MGWSVDVLYDVIPRPAWKTSTLMCLFDVLALMCAYLMCCWRVVMAGGVPVGVPVDVDDVLVGVTASVPWFVVCHIEKQTTTERRDGHRSGVRWSGRTATYAYFNSSILVSLVSPACLRNSARTIVRSACALGLCWWRAETGSGREETTRIRIETATREEEQRERGCCCGHNERI